MEELPKIKKNKNRKSFQYCLTCYKHGHETQVCFKLDKKKKKEAASTDSAMRASEFVNKRSCEVLFGYYDLRVTHYLYWGEFRKDV